MQVPRSGADTRALRARVLLVDSHPAMRRMVRGLLEEADMEVVAESVTQTGLPRLVSSHDPDVLVLDLAFDSAEGLRSIRLLRARVPGLVIVATTMHENAAFERAALSAGASACVLKDSADPALPEAIRTALAARRGGAYAQ